MMTKINRNTIELSEEQIALYEESKIRFSKSMSKRNSGYNNFLKRNPEKSHFFGTNGWENSKCRDLNMWASAMNLKDAMDAHPNEKYNFFNRAFNFKTCCFHMFNKIKDETFGWEDWERWDKSKLTPYEFIQNTPTLDRVGEIKARKLWENGRATKGDHIQKWLCADYIFGVWSNWTRFRGNVRFGFWKFLEMKDNSYLNDAFKGGWNPSLDEEWVKWRNENKHLIKDDMFPGRKSNTVSLTDI